MFTGIIATTGRVRRTATGNKALVLDLALQDISEGESVAVNGVCLTVSATGEGWASFDLSRETRDKTTLGHLKAGSRVNIERALRLSDRLGGHLVTGHVDGKSRIARIRKVAQGREMTIALPRNLSKYLVGKGSVAVEGVSLTVGEVKGDGFTLFLVPFTLDRTTLGEKRVGDEVNLEVDILARYLRG